MVMITNEMDATVRSISESEGWVWGIIKKVALFDTSHKLQQMV